MGTESGLNTTIEPCNGSHEQNTGNDLTPCYANSCDDMREDAILGKSYLIPQGDSNKNLQSDDNKRLRENTN